MNCKRLIVLILVVGAGFWGNGCTKANLGLPPAPTTALVEKQDDAARPLYFIDNVEVKDFKQVKISPSDIQSINVLRPSATNDLVSTYGPNAKNGVILVTTKNSK